MALTSERIAYSNLPANWNFPCHHEQPPHTFRSKEVLHVVRYDTRLDIFGLISPIYSDNAAFDAELERANAAIGRRPATSFFSMYKQHVARQAAALVPVTPKRIFSQAFVARTRIGDRKRRLVLHGGTPKTGTSSLQDYLGANRSMLAEEGWWYPPPDGVASLKHQGLVLALLGTDESAFVEYIESALRDMPDHAHTVMLTTEGIFNHWWDYTPEAKGLMRHLAALFDFELCVWFRQPEEFAASHYVQNLKNSRIAGLPCDSYGRDIDFTDAMRDEWFLRHLDLLGVLLRSGSVVRVRLHQGTSVYGRYGPGVSGSVPDRWNAREPPPEERVDAAAGGSDAADTQQIRIGASGEESRHGADSSDRRRHWGTGRKIFIERNGAGPRCPLYTAWMGRAVESGWLGWSPQDGGSSGSGEPTGVGGWRGAPVRRARPVTHELRVRVRRGCPGSPMAVRTWRIR